MILRPLTSPELKPYEALAQEHGSMFERADWTALFGDRLRKYGIFDKGGRLVGGLNLYEDRRWGIRLLRNPPYTPPCGPFFRMDSSNPVAVLGRRRRILEATATLFDEQGRCIISFALNKAIEDGLPFYWNGFKVVPSYTYVLNLTPSLEDIRRGMSAVRRNDISKAERDGLVAETVEDLSIVRDLVDSSFARQNKGVDPHIDAILTRYARPDNSFAYAAMLDGRAVACCFVVHDEATAYYLLGGYRTGATHHGAGALAVYAAIQHAKHLGLTEFDFEGSILPAIERFVRGFGGQLTPYLTVNKAWLPFEMMLKLLKRPLF